MISDLTWDMTTHPQTEKTSVLKIIMACSQSCPCPLEINYVLAYPRWAKKILLVGLYVKKKKKITGEEANVLKKHFNFHNLHGFLENFTLWVGASRPLSLGPPVLPFMGDF